jgi:hypothetical protein
VLRRIAGQLFDGKADDLVSPLCRDCLVQLVHKVDEPPVVFVHSLMLDAELVAPG